MNQFVQMPKVWFGDHILPSQDLHYPSHSHNGSCEDILSGVPVAEQQLDFGASLSEWILTGAVLLFLTLFAYEFKVRGCCSESYRGLS